MNASMDFPMLTECLFMAFLAVTYWICNPSSPAGMIVLLQLVALDLIVVNQLIVRSPTSMPPFLRMWSSFGDVHRSEHSRLDCTGCVFYRKKDSYVGFFF